MIILLGGFISKLRISCMSIARDIMSKKLVTLDSTVSAAEVAKIMDKNNVSCIVLTKDDKSQGIVTERDLLSNVIVQNKKSSELMAREIMTSPVISVSSLMSVDEVAQKMIDKKIRRVIVIDNGQPLGIITVTDFVKHFNTILSNSENSKSEIYQNLMDDYEYWDN
jgi:signal-transduction protein with cAMP-binding, CBS, and nucleotidyltransferase domain